MKRRLLAATAILALLAACDAQGGDPAANQANGAAAAEPAAQPDSAPAQAEQISMVAVPRDTALQLMHERHENYEDIGDAMKVITRELRGDQPDLAAIRVGADTIATLAPQIPSWFPAGTGPDVGETHALAAIWQRPEDFSAKAQALEEQANAFRAAAQGTDLAAIRAAHADLGQACKACHDLYREEE
jgi:cytochrome c556